ncbi:MAG: hypothetical protein ACLQAN_02725 [Acidimicrobiales bacterium]
MVTAAGARILRCGRRSWRRLAEALALVASPGVAYVTLRLRGMAPVQLPDPSMHTTFVVDPRDIFTRYAAVFAPTARMREAARVGFLVPARAAYLAFGAVGGFFTLRYLLALVAVVPLYLLLARTHGRWAGWVGVAVVLSSPVFVTAWGTDYPDSAAISYLTGALCALAMPAAPRRRPFWLATAAGLVTLAVWSHGAAVPLGAAALLAYAVVRARRARDHLLRDAATLLGAALLVTGLLMVCSGLLLGQTNFLTPTWEAAFYLATPAQEALWHSANWRWVLDDPYLLVPPAALLAFAVVSSRRGRDLGTPQAFLGLAALLAFGVAAALQFAGRVQMLEVHYFSSLLWSFVAVLLSLTLAELAAPLVAAARQHDVAGRSRAAWAAARGALPALLVVGVALAYEADPHVPQMRLDYWGWAVAGIAVGATLVWRLGGLVARHPSFSRRAGLCRDAGAPAVAVVLAGALLILTVAPVVVDTHLSDVALDDVPPAYAHALGGSDSALVDEYEVTCELPGFVGHAAYAGEQLLMWWPEKERNALVEPAGMFHSNFNAVTGPFPNLIPSAKENIEERRPAEVLLMSLNGLHFSRAVWWLTPFAPRVVKKAVLADGAFHLHVWLVDLRYLRPPKGDRR